MEIEGLRKEIRTLRNMVVLLASFLAVALVGASVAVKDTVFDEITVHRLNLVDNNGTLRLAISNKEHFPPLLLHGKPYGKGMRSSGGAASIFYYNALGDEQGATFWDGFRQGDAYEQYATTTYDQFQGDNDMILSFDDSTGKHNGGLTIENQQQTTPLDKLDDQLKEELRRAKTPEESKSITRAFNKAHFTGVPRLFAGYIDREGSEIKLSDKEGRKRIQMVVDDDGNARLLFLDAQGKVVYELPGPVK